MNTIQTRTEHGIPVELILDILSRLPVKSLMRFKCVSHEWCNLIGDPDFATVHQSRSHEANHSSNVMLIGNSSLHYVDFEHPQNQQTKELYFPKILKDWKGEVELVGSSNGLLCFGCYTCQVTSSKYKTRQFTIYNPVTRAYKQLPELGAKRFRYPHSFQSDFGYDCISDDYKVLCFIGNYNIPVFNRENLLFSLKSNSWEVIQNPPWREDLFRESQSVATNNYLHWSVSDKEIYDYSLYNDDEEEVGDDGGYAIWRFNLFTQVYDKIPAPTKGAKSPSLAVLKGLLHLITYDIEIWVWKEYGIKESWTKLFHSVSVDDCIPRNRWPSYQAYSKDGRRVLVGLSKYFIFNVSCNLDTQEVSMVKIQELPGDKNSKFDVVPWMASLVPIDTD